MFLSLFLIIFLSAKQLQNFGLSEPLINFISFLLYIKLELFKVHFIFGQSITCNLLHKV